MRAPLSVALTLLLGCTGSHGAARDGGVSAPPVADGAPLDAAALDGAVAREPAPLFGLRRDDGALVVERVDDGEVRSLARLSLPEGFADVARGSPTGRWIAVTAVAERLGEGAGELEQRVVLVDAETGAERRVDARLVSGDCEVPAARWLADGSGFVLACESADETVYILGDLDGVLRPLEVELGCEIEHVSPVHASMTVRCGEAWSLRSVDDVSVLDLDADGAIVTARPIAPDAAAGVIINRDSRPVFARWETGAAMVEGVAAPDDAHLDHGGQLAMSGWYMSAVHVFSPWTGEGLERNLCGSVPGSRWAQPTPHPLQAVVGCGESLSLFDFESAEMTQLVEAGRAFAHWNREGTDVLVETVTFAVGSEFQRFDLETGSLEPAWPAGPSPDFVGFVRGWNP